MFRLTEPTDAEVERRLRRLAGSAFSYAAVGATRDIPPGGFTIDRYGVDLGEGEAVLARARAALARFDNYPPPWTRVVLPGPLEPGAVFATVASHVGLWSINPCRVIYVEDEPRRFAFGFGTLEGHAERGEERFAVELDEGSSRVRYDVLAFSRPAALLARLGAPVARHYQRRFAREGCAAMARAVRA